jgi:hypothetical protein
LHKKNQIMFALAKLWTDNNSGPDPVAISYTCTEPGHLPQWQGEEDTQIMVPISDFNPAARRAIIEIPRYLNGSDRYVLHYRFGRAGENRNGLSPVFTEEIRARELEYVDHEGWLTEVRLLWSINGWDAPNWTQASLEGLDLNLNAMAAGHDAEGEGIADNAIYELIQTVPLPRRYRAKVWAPRGATVEYAYQLLRTNAPVVGEDEERWDNNHGRNFQLVME